MEREVSESAILGAAAGIFLWLFDLRHLFLGGERRAVVSDFIQDRLVIDSRPVLDAVCDWGRYGINVTCTNLGVLVILTISGAVSFGILVKLMILLKRKG